PPSAPAPAYAGIVNSTVINQAFAVMPTLLSANGSAITACAVTGSPAAPSWLTVGSDCVIRGTPASAFSAVTYNVVATNAAGSSAPAPVTLRALSAAAAPLLGYSGATGTTGRVG